MTLRLLLVAAVALPLCLTGLSASAPSKAVLQNKVYVCNSSAAVAYHNSTSCSGLRRCKHEIITVSRREATENYGKRACKLCY